MSEPSNKRYELMVGDLLKIPAGRFDYFLDDLKKWHKAARTTLDLLNVLAEALDEREKAVVGKMIWVDDGKHDGKVIILTAPSPNTEQEEKK